jgi:hypothetical protein
MNQNITSDEHRIRREIAKEILKNEEEKLLRYPYCHQDVQCVAKVVNLSEEETRSLLQELILERWHAELFKDIQEFFEGKNQLYNWFENSEDEEEIISDALFNSWFKGHLHNFLSRFEKEFEYHDDPADPTILLTGKE